MTLSIEQTNKGKPCLLIGKFKYREAYVAKNGDVTWRCLAKQCGASAKTNGDRTRVIGLDDVHTGSHPATMRTVSLSSTPPRISSPSASPTASGDLPLSPLVSQLMSRKDTRNASTETDALFLNTKDELVSKVQKLTGVQSSLVDKIQSLTLELESTRQQLTEALGHLADGASSGVTSLSAADVSSASCQTEESITLHVPLTPSENLAGVETVMVACQTDEGFPLVISQQELGDSDTSIEACPSAPLPRDDTPSLSSNLLEMRRNKRKLTDDEVWEGLRVIDNEGVLVLIPSVCLTIRFAGSTNPIVEALGDLHNTKHAQVHVDTILLLSEASQTAAVDLAHRSNFIFEITLIVCYSMCEFM
ncbi:hypothetical protein J6590_097448 [Homalodisca vitripennis]|nr:hypothetical protein J6590_097448 [Homalodisca vitripennis]